MKTLLMTTLLLACLVAAGASNAAPLARTVDVVRDGTAHRALYSIAFQSDNLHGAAVGERGLIVVTSDGGKSWSDRQLDTRAKSLKLAHMALTGVATSDAHWVAVGQKGMVFRSTDAGQNWSRVDAPSDERLLGVDINRDGLTVAVGAFGTILLSSDGGASWHKPDFNAATLVKDGYDPHLYDVQVADDGSVLAVGEFGLILRSEDGGESWKPVHEGNASLFRLHLNANGVGYAVGQSGTVLRTADGGKTWSALETGVSVNLLDVYAGPNGEVVVPGMRHMIVSDDSGKTWTQMHDGDVDRNWYSAIAGGSGGVYAVGHTGRVIRIGKK